MSRRSIQVWADWRGLPRAAHVGTLHAQEARGKEVFSFEYERTWLANPHALVLDPALSHFTGPQYPRAGRQTFGVFQDSSPDRWGRVLLERREALRARDERRTVRPLRELDFLLGVFDGHRMGGLRYRRDGNSPFLDDDAELASPPWTSIRELETASLSLESDDAESSREYRQWLSTLLAPGRSLGGARPKASVVDPDGALWIAKFPSERDTQDVGGWEFVVHRLAAAAGVDCAPALSKRFGHAHHTFLTRRFDRRGETRIHFASAMTMLEREDGEEGASYLDLAEVLARVGTRPRRDLEQLWRRIVFFQAVSNADDHLRNHGFLLRRDGWVLAPAYDINPIPTASGLTLNISERDNALDHEIALAVAPQFRLRLERARSILSDVRVAVRQWRSEASSIGLSRAAIDPMANAFRLAET